MGGGGGGGGGGAANLSLVGFPSICSDLLPLGGVVCRQQFRAAADWSVGSLWEIKCPLVLRAVIGKR